MKLARGQRTLWQGAVCTLRTAVHSPGDNGPVPGAPSRLLFPKQACRLRPENGCEVAPFAAGLCWFRFVPTQGSRQNGPPRLAGVCHSLLPLSALPVTGFVGAVPPVSGFGRFRHLRVSGNAHKPLNFQEETHHG